MRAKTSKSSLDCNPSIRLKYVKKRLAAAQTKQSIGTGLTKSDTTIFSSQFVQQLLFRQCRLCLL